VAPLGLTFEAWLYHPQLTNLADLARAYPQTTIVLNHVGGPLGIGRYKDKKAETFGQWKAGILEVVKSPNVVVKLADRHVRLLHAPKTTLIGGACDRL
jgi:L-fuconolactonase